MGKLIFNGISKKIFLSACNYYGASLRVSVLDDDANEFLAENVPMTEIVEPVTAFDTTVTTVANKGEKVVTVNKVTGLSKSDRIRVVNEVYRVVDIDIVGKNITLHTGLLEDIPVDGVIERVGNMGIFKIQLAVTRNGYFVIQAKDTKFGLQHSESLTVKENSIETLLEYTNVEINENERVIRETSSYTIII